jgi:hypothetical protein
MLDALKVAVLLALLSGGIWIAGPYDGWLSNTRTVYLAFCPAFDGTNCSTTWVRHPGPITFTAIRDQQLVITKRQDGSLASDSDCVVLDADNWRCSEHWMVDGNYQMKSLGTMYWKQVSRLRWTRLRGP